MNSALADAILVVHFGWVAFVVIGQLLIALGMMLGWGWIRNFWFRFAHLTMMLLVVIEVIFSVNCPLTVWENRLRGIGPGQSVDHAQMDSFIAHWLGRMMFYDDLDGTSWPFVVAYITFTLLVVWSFAKAPPRLPMSTGAFVALIHAVIGLVLVTTVTGMPIGVIVVFFVEALVWWALSRRRQVSPAEIPFSRDPKGSADGVPSERMAISPRSPAGRGETGVGTSFLARPHSFSRTDMWCICCAIVRAPPLR
jgi:hypothetical protein